MDKLIAKSLRHCDAPALAEEFGPGWRQQTVRVIDASRLLNLSVPETYKRVGAAGKVSLGAMYDYWEVNRSLPRPYTLENLKSWSEEHGHHLGFANTYAINFLRAAGRAADAGAPLGEATFLENKLASWGISKRETDEMKQMSGPHRFRHKLLKDPYTRRKVRHGVYTVQLILDYFIGSTPTTTNSTRPLRHHSRQVERNIGKIDLNNKGSWKSALYLQRAWNHLFALQACGCGVFLQRAIPECITMIAYVDPGWSTHPISTEQISPGRDYLVWYPPVTNTNYNRVRQTNELVRAHVLIFSPTTLMSFLSSEKRFTKDALREIPGELILSNPHAFTLRTASL